MRLLVCCCHTWACVELFLGAETSKFVLCLTQSVICTCGTGRWDSSVYSPFSGFPNFGHGRFLQEQI